MRRKPAARTAKPAPRKTPTAETKKQEPAAETNASMAAEPTIRTRPSNTLKRGSTPAQESESPAPKPKANPKKGEGLWAVGRPAGDDGPRDLEPHLFNIIDVRSTCIHRAHI